MQDVRQGVLDGLFEAGALLPEMPPLRQMLTPASDTAIGADPLIV